MPSVTRPAPSKSNVSTIPKQNLKSVFGFGTVFNKPPHPSLSTTPNYTTRKSVDTARSYKQRRRQRADRSSITEASFYTADSAVPSIPIAMKNFDPANARPLRRPPVRIDAQEGPWSVSVAETPHDASSYSLYIKSESSLLVFQYPAPPLPCDPFSRHVSAGIPFYMRHQLFFVVTAVLIVRASFQPPLTTSLSPAPPWKSSSFTTSSTSPTQAQSFRIYPSTSTPSHLLHQNASLLSSTPSPGWLLQPLENQAVTPGRQQRLSIHRACLPPSYLHLSKCSTHSPSSLSPRTPTSRTPTPTLTELPQSQASLHISPRSPTRLVCARPACGNGSSAFALMI